MRHSYDAAIAAAKDLIADMGPIHPNTPVGRLTWDETELLTKLAGLLTRTRTGVDRDYKGDPISAHAPEMPTRLAKEFAQVMRGAMAIGMSEPEAMALVFRCARDTMEPRRRAILLDLLEHPRSTGEEVSPRVLSVLTTVKRDLTALWLLGLVTCEDVDLYSNNRRYEQARYSLSLLVDQGLLLSM